MGLLSQGLLGFAGGAALGAARVYEQQAADQEYNRRQALQEQQDIRGETRRAAAAEAAQTAKEKRDRELEIIQNREKAAADLVAREEQARVDERLKAEFAAAEAERAADREAIVTDARLSTETSHYKEVAALEEQDGVAPGTYGGKVPRVERPVKPLSLKPSDVAKDVEAIVDQSTPASAEWPGKFKTNKEKFAQLASLEDAEERLELLTDPENKADLVKSVAARIAGDVSSRAGGAALEEGGLVDPNVSARIADSVLQSADTVVSEWQDKASSAAEWAEYKSKGSKGAKPASRDIVGETKEYARQQFEKGKTPKEIQTAIRQGWDKKLQTWLGAGGDPLQDNSGMSGTLRSAHNKLFDDIYGPLMSAINNYGVGQR